MQEEILLLGPPATLLCHTPHTGVGFPFNDSHAAQFCFSCLPTADSSVINTLTCIALYEKEIFMQDGTKNTAVHIKNWQNGLN